MELQADQVACGRKGALDTGALLLPLVVVAAVYENK
jgi:hypothetical protein